jgi:hypothetical protein
MKPVILYCFVLFLMWGLIFSVMNVQEMFLYPVGAIVFAIGLASVNICHCMTKLYERFEDRCEQEQKEKN